MRYVIVGAGAIGGVVGGLLAAAGREVLLVARGDHGRAIAADGLLVRRPDGDLRVSPPVAGTVAEARLRASDAVVLAVKSQSTPALLDELAALAVGRDRALDVVPLLTMQNGVANEDAALRIAAHAHGVCVNLPATHLEPGVVIGEGSPAAGVLTLGRADGGTDGTDDEAVADLRAAGFMADASEDVMAWKRAKLLRNVGNAVQALGGPEPGDDQMDAVRDLDRRARDEAVACFAAAGLPVTGDEEYRASAGRFGTAPVAGHERGGGSTWQSLARGQGTVETDWLNGEVVRVGRLTGTPTPVNAMLQRETWRLVSEGGEPGSRRPTDLLALVR